jgi:hypothetical protein
MLDERFFSHRWRATSHAAVVGAVTAAGWFLYHQISEGVLRWDLASILLAMAVTKVGAMLYYRSRD